MSDSVFARRLVISPQVLFFCGRGFQPRSSRLETRAHRGNV